MPTTLNGRVPHPLDEDERKGDELPSAAPASAGDDWSYATRELLDTLPKPWTRGLLYFLAVFAAIALPWAVLYKVEETGTARGRLELKGGTVKQEADIAGAVTAVQVKEGDSVRAGDIIIELDSKPVRDQLQQDQIKLEGQQNRLSQLQLIKNQLALALSAQQRENQAQKLEKLAQVNQAQQNLEALQTAYKFEKEEKQAQVNQARENLEALQAAYNLQKEEKLAQVEQERQTLERNKGQRVYADGRLAYAREKVEDYKSAFEEGALSKNLFAEAKQLAKDSEEGILKAQSEIALSQSRLKEQQNSYDKIIHQARADIEQAKLRLEEQRDNAEKILHQARADIEQAKLRLEEQKSAYDRLIEAGKLAVAKSEQEIKELETQIATLKSEMAQTLSQIKAQKEELQKYTVRAKKDGTIFQLPITRPGAVVERGKLIAEIAPNGNHLIFKGEIPTSETESLWQGEKKEAKLKFDAYRVEDYGVVAGTLVWRAPNSKIAETAQGQVATYDVEIELDRTCIQTPTECIPLTAGQTATAEVIIRRRRIIDFIIDPFKKLQKGGMQL